MRVLIVWLLGSVLWSEYVHIWSPGSRKYIVKPEQQLATLAPRLRSWNTYVFLFVILAHLYVHLFITFDELYISFTVSNVNYLMEKLFLFKLVKFWLELTDTTLVIIWFEYFSVQLKSCCNIDESISNKECWRFYKMGGTANIKKRFNGLLVWKIASTSCKWLVFSCKEDKNNKIKIKIAVANRIQSQCFLYSQHEVKMGAIQKAGVAGMCVCVCVCV